MMKKLYFRAIVCMVMTLMMLFSLVACASNTPATPPPAAGGESSSGGGESSPAGFTGQIRIGVNLPFTGSVALNGEMIAKGAEFAVYEVNKAGGINGKEVVLVKEDDQGEPNQAAAIANKFVADPTILAIIGNLKSSCTLAAAPILNEGGLVTLSPDSSSPKVTDAGDWIFRIKNSDVFLARMAVQAAIDDGYSSVAIMYENNDFGMGVLEQATIQLAENGLEPVVTETILTGEQTDFSTAIANISAAKADAVLFGADYNEAGLMMKQMKDAGLDLPRYGTDGLYTNALLEVGGEAANGTNALTTFFPTDPNPVVQKYCKDYKAWSGDDATIFDAEGYDAAMILMEAIKNAGEDRQAIRDYMATMSYIGVIGDCTFDENGDVNIPLKRVRIVNGAFELLP